MTYIVNDKCIKCKLMDCVEVCPVDCFYEGKNMLVIKPDECIDCGVCEPECPVGAIAADTESGSEKWLEINKKSWNLRTGMHVDSAFYNLKGFKKSKNSLHSLEIDLLGDIQNESILHLQCHFGMDSLSLEGMGAKVTGIDFSDEAIDFAQNLAKELEMQTEFICANVYDFELAKKNIRVNTVNPSPVETRMMRSLEEGLMPGQAIEAKKMFEANIPLGRYASSSDVAKLMLFLASEDSSFITGSVYTVDGGSTA